MTGVNRALHLAVLASLMSGAAFAAPQAPQRLADAHKHFPPSVSRRRGKAKSATPKVRASWKAAAKYKAQRRANRLRRKALRK